MYFGENGIVEKAKAARAEHEEAMGLETGALTGAGVEGKIDSVVVGGTETITTAKGEAVVYGGDLSLGTNVSLVPYDTLSPEIKTAVTDGKVKAVVKEIIGGNDVEAVIPTGYSIDSTANTISGGLVITDGENEFVWIPVPEKNMVASYAGDSGYSEPTELSDDASNVTYYYGGTLNYSSDFDYTGDYAEMVASVNKYGGFYIGRYETTINGTSIGSKLGQEVLTVDKTLASLGNNEALWWGLYYLQRRANVEGNGTAVQTNMIWGQQWDKMIAYFDNQSIDYSATEVSSLSTSGIQASGQALYNGNTINDVIYNIYDLRGNGLDWTAEAGDTYARVLRGGAYDFRCSADLRCDDDPGNADNYGSCRATLYIK